MKPPTIVKSFDGGEQVVLLVTVGALCLPGAAAFFQSGVERVEACGAGVRKFAREYRAFVLPFPRSAKTLLK